MTYAVGYVNNDNGQFSELLIGKLENATDLGLEDILTMVQYDDTDSLKDAFRQGSIKAGLIIDYGYNLTNANETVTLFVDEADISGSWAITSRVITVSQIFSDESPKEYFKPLDEPIAVEFSMMNFMVVGTLTYAVSTIIFSTAASIAKERDKGTFSRLRTTPMSTVDFLAGGINQPTSCVPNTNCISVWSFVPPRIQTDGRHCHGQGGKHVGSIYCSGAISRCVRGCRTRHSSLRQKRGSSSRRLMVSNHPYDVPIWNMGRNHGTNHDEDCMGFSNHILQQSDTSDPSTRRSSSKHVQLSDRFGCICRNHVRNRRVYLSKEDDVKQLKMQKLMYKTETKKEGV